MSAPAWHPIDEGFGVGERIELGDVLVAWVDPVRTRPGEPDPTADWTGKSNWSVGYEDGGEPCEPLADGYSATRAGARRDALAAAFGKLDEALEASKTAAQAAACRP